MVFLRESAEEEIRKFIALTYASVAYVDHCIGQILASVERLGYSKNTIVIYMSDHGDLMSDQGLVFPNLDILKNYCVLNSLKLI